MQDYEYERYVCNADNLKETLEKYGVAIIPSIINEEECKKMRDGMWESIEHITQNFDKPVIKKVINKDDIEEEIIVWKPIPAIKRDNVETWKSFTQLYPLHSMLLQRFTLSHAQYYWDLRQNPVIVNIFANLWDVKPEELLVSFDGLSLHLPPEKTDRGWFRNNNWMHVDASFNPGKNNHECYQSFLSANEIRQGDATFSFLEGSHKYHKKVGKKFKITEKANWYKFDEKEYNYYLKKGCGKKCIKCPSGSLIIWNSKTCHQGQEPLKERIEENERCIVYLCYTPRIWATKSNLKKKIKAFEELRTCNHVPHNPKLFPVHPRTYGQALPNVIDVEHPVLNELGKKLVGY